MAVDRNKLIASAQKYIQKGQFRKAIKDYEAIVAAYPDDIRVLLKIGDLQAREGLNSDAVRTYNEVADYYVAHGFFLKAVAVYKQLLRVQPDDIAAQLRLADLYAQLSLFSDALAQFQHVAQQLLLENRHTQYLQVLVRMVEIDPSRVGNRIKLAEQLLKIDDTRGAAVHFGAACDYLLNEGRFEEYIKVAERFVHQVPDDTERIRQLARVYLEVGRPSNAAATLQPLFRNDRYDAESLRLLIEAMIRMGQAERAAAALRDLIPVFEHHNRDAERDLAYELLLRIDPSDPMARRHAAALAGDDDDEMTFELVDDAPAVLNAEQLATLARLISETDVYLKYSLYEKSLAHLEQVFQLDPGNLEGLRRRTRIYQDLGRTREAAIDLLAMVRTGLRTGAARAECEAWLRDADALAPDLPGLEHARNELHRTSAEVPELDAEELLLPDEASGFGTREPEHDVLEEFDALFDQIATPTEDTAGNEALDQDEAFFRDLESAFGEHEGSSTGDGGVLALQTDEFLPAELDEALDRSLALAHEGQLSDAHALLLELMGQWPEHAEVILRRLDELPSSEEVAAALAAAGFEDIPSVVDFVPVPLATEQPEPQRFVPPSVVPTLPIAPPPPVAPLPPVAASALPDAEDDPLFMDEDAEDAVSSAVHTDDDVLFDAEIVDDFDDFGDDQPVSSHVPVPAAAPAAAPVPEAAPAPVVTTAFEDDSALDDLIFDDEGVEDMIVIDEYESSGVAAAAVDAPIGRPPAGAALEFGPTQKALAEASDPEFHAAVELARLGHHLEAMDALQEQLFGDYPIAASFELACVRLFMGEYVEANRALEALERAPDLAATDVRTIRYVRSLCLEALDSVREARVIWSTLQKEAPGAFPDLGERARRAHSA